MIKIEQLTQVTTKAVEEINLLLPQLSTDASPLTYAGLLEFLKDPSVTFLVVKDGAKIIGMGTLIVHYTIKGKKGELEHIVIDEKYRGKGYGEQLMKKIIELGREHKIRHLNLTSKPERVAAHKLYEKLGFEQRKTDVFRMKL